jgi:hypothetical protein
MSTPSERRILEGCQKPWRQPWEIPLALHGTTNGALPMWSLVNASYGIAMGQRPAGTAETSRHRRSSPPVGAAMLSSDPRLEATQLRRREHLAQAAHEQSVEQSAIRARPIASISASPGWAPRFWLRLWRAASGHRARVFTDLTRQKRGELGHLD